MGFFRAVRAHPWITTVCVLCTGGGALLTWAIGIEDFSPARNVAAGALAGAGVAYMIVASRTLGAFAESPDDPPRDASDERRT